MKRLNLAAVLSVMLPGLGQLYQGLPVTAFAAYFIFLSVLTTPSLQGFAPVVAIGAGVDALRRGAEQGPRNARRDYLYSAVGIAGFIGWFLLAAGVFLPFRLG